MPRKQLNPQHPVPHQQYKLHHQLQPDVEEDGRASYRIDQGELMIKESTKELSFPI